MCYVCCKEFRGWCKSFTKTETLLSIIEGVLLLILTIFLIFLILHLLACSKEERLLENDPTVATQSSKDDLQTTSTISTYQTVPPHIMCTWELLKTTEAITHYYELDQRNTATEYSTRPVGTSYSTYTVSPVTDDFKNNSFINNVSDWSDGVEAVDEKQFMLALVKIRPPQDITFGCILTVITEYWVLTAASCIEAIEEIDSLDSFVMMKGYGESKLGRSHTVDDVRIHPWYQGNNKSYDLAALKSEDSLINKGDSAVILSTMLDYFMITLGEKLTLLGYGRTIDDGPAGRVLCKVEIYVLPRGQCAEAREDEDAWSPRHLRRGECGGSGGECGARALCAGGRRARSARCVYCAGAPLLRGGRLAGVRAAAPASQCAAAREPATYVNVAAVRDWLDHLRDNQDVV